MEKVLALQAMSALSQPTRFEVVRLLGASSDGLSAGQISRALETTPSAMSAHLAILARAGLLSSEKAGRTVTYRVAPKVSASLVRFLEKSLPTK